MTETLLATAARKSAGPAVLLLIVIGFFWKIVLTDQYSWLEFPDLAYQVVPWLNYQAQQFHLHHFPIWDPFLYGGQSLIGQGQPGLAYPLNWLLFALPLDQGHISIAALNWFYTLTHYLAALISKTRESTCRIPPSTSATGRSGMPHRPSWSNAAAIR